MFLQHQLCTRNPRTMSVIKEGCGTSSKGNLAAKRGREHTKRDICKNRKKGSKIVLEISEITNIF